MPEARDRLARPVDISVLLPNAARRVGLMVDEPGLIRQGLLFDPMRIGPATDERPSPGDGSRREAAANARLALGRGFNLNRSPLGRENVSARIVRRARSRGRPRNSVLPSWYPRTPLGDITAVVRAIERRRARLRDADASEMRAPNNDGERAEEPPFQTDNASASRIQLEHNIVETTPLPATLGKKPRNSPASRMWSIVSRIVDEENDGFVTPKNKLLNSIEKVREVFLEEQRKNERTPAARKAERERKVRVLMSMR